MVMRTCTQPLWQLEKHFRARERYSTPWNRLYGRFIMECSRTGARESSICLVSSTARSSLFPLEKVQQGSVAFPLHWGLTVLAWNRNQEGTIVGGVGKGCSTGGSTEGRKLLCSTVAWMQQGPLPGWGSGFSPFAEALWPPSMGSTEVTELLALLSLLFYGAATGSMAG